MGLTMCESLAGYGEILLGEEEAKTGIVLLQCPAPQMAEMALLSSVGRWILKLDCDPAPEQSDLFQGLAQRAEEDQLSSIAVIGHAPQSLRNLAGLELSERVQRRNHILAEAQQATIQSAKCINENISGNLSTGKKLAIVTLFYHNDSGTLQIHDGHDSCWKAVPNAPAC